MKKFLLLFLIIPALVFISSCDESLPEEPTGLSSDEIFGLMISSFDSDGLISDIIETHRAIGDYPAWIESTSYNEATKKQLLDDYEKANVGNTGVTDYMDALDTVNGKGSVISLAYGSGKGSFPFKYDDSKVFNNGLMFKNIAIGLDPEGTEPRTGNVTLDVVFTEDYEGCFIEGSDFVIKKGSEAFLKFECEYGYLGAGQTTGDNVELAAKSYTISTVDPNANDEELSIVSGEPAGLIIIHEGKEYSVSIEALSGVPSAYFGLDIKKGGTGILDMLNMALKTSITINSVELPAPGNEIISIDGTAVDYKAVYDALTGENFRAEYY